MAIDDGELIFSVRGLGDIESLGRDGVVAATKLTEEAGFDMIWCGNDFLSGGGLATLTVMLMSSERIKVASGVLDPVTIHPGQIAQFASGLQWLSNDRFICGIGAGSDEMFKWASVPHDRPVPRTREAVLAIRALTEGRDLSTETLAGGPWLPTARLYHPRAVPIYVGAMGPKMLEMSGRFADGVIALALPPRHVFHIMEQVAVGAAREGRNLADIDIAAGVWLGISEDDPASARAGLRRHIALMSGSLSVDALAANGLDPEEFAHVQALLDEGRKDDAIAAVTPGMMELGFVGGPTEIIDQCAVLIEAGCRHISFGMPGAGIDKLAAVRLLGEKVVPELRRMAAA
jgi:5,10-methylenetetrahydromethanopterin reductase